MNLISPYLGFASVSLLVAVSPGPSWAYTISTTLGHGRKAGMVGNLGNSTGILCQGVVVLLGLAALLQVSLVALTVLKYLGVAYLGYLALRTIRLNTTLAIPAGQPAVSRWQIFRNGVLVSLFNPKITLLLLALVPQFVDPSGPIRPGGQIAIMVAMHAVVAGLVHTHVVLFSSLLGNLLRKSRRVQGFLRWVMGGLFLGFGVRLALSDLR